MSGERVVGLGLCTPVGTTAAMTLASMRAGLARFAETAERGAHGEPVRASRLSTLDPSSTRTERMIALGRAALDGVRERLKASPTGRVPLYLGLPEPGLGAPVARESLLAALQAAPPGQAGGALVLTGAFDGGRAAFFEALSAALGDLRAGRVGSMAVVGAVDSLCDADSLSALSAARLHLCAQNRDGRIPGEAAGFVVVARPGAAAAMGLEALGVVLGVALGAEPAPFASRVPSAADGLTGVLRALRGDEAAGARRVDEVMSCQPGESFWATELSRAYLRNAALMPEPLALRAAGEWLGDAGAGAAPVMLAAALHRRRRRAQAAGAAGRAPRTLVYGSADGGRGRGGRVGACVVEAIFGGADGGEGR
ncbi:3-oxoacyl-ACP synthase [Sorangium sp. So ce1014]|uniref:3-oxoacyl-ACP synthase n=1 Tax=Sorangium sp. So ce1014 TaxID=3133326 RepID=UPI003F6340D9